MINNAATTYLLLQSAHNNAYPYHGSHLMNLLVGAPLIAVMFFLSIGLVLDVVFKWEPAFDFMIKIVSILILVSVIGLIIALFV